MPRWLSCKEPISQCMRGKRHRFSLWVGKIPWIRKWQPSPVFLPGKSLAWKILAWRARVHGVTKSRTQLSMHPRWWSKYSKCCIILYVKEYLNHPYCKTGISSICHTYVKTRFTVYQIRCFYNGIRISWKMQT